MKIIIVGAGGQGRIVADALLRAHEAGDRARPIGFVDDQQQQPMLGLPILGPVDALADIPHDGIVVAIGDNARRRLRSEELTARGETIVTARHPWSSIAPDATIGVGTMISAGVVVTPGATVGRGALLNTRSSVDHDTFFGDFAHVSAGGTVGALAYVGDEVLIGVGATLLSGCRIGARSIIGAGAVVVRDIPGDVVAYGNPARVRRAR